MRGQWPKGATSRGGGAGIIGFSHSNVHHTADRVWSDATSREGCPLWSGTCNALAAAMLVLSIHGQLARTWSTKQACRQSWLDFCAGRRGIWKRRRRRGRAVARMSSMTGPWRPRRSAARRPLMWRMLPPSMAERCAHMTTHCWILQIGGMALEAAGAEPMQHEDRADSLVWTCGATLVLDGITFVRRNGALTNEMSKECTPRQAASACGNATTGVVCQEKDPYAPTTC